MLGGLTFSYNCDVHCGLSASHRARGGKNTYSKADLVLRITGLLTKACLR